MLNNYLKNSSTHSKRKLRDDPQSIIELMHRGRYWDATVTPRRLMQLYASAFSFRGRLSASGYCLTSALLMCTCAILAELVNNEMLMQTISNLHPHLKVIIMAICILLLVCCAVIMHVKRLHDLGLSGRWFAFYLVPILNLFFPIYLALRSGNGQANYFGDSPYPAPTHMSLCSYPIFFLTIGSNLFPALGEFIMSELPFMRFFIFLIRAS